jgi:hypothetical protein
MNQRCGSDHVPDLSGLRMNLPVTPVTLTLQRVHDVNTCCSEQLVVLLSAPAEML